MGHLEIPILYQQGKSPVNLESFPFVSSCLFLLILSSVSFLGCFLLTDFSLWIVFFCFFVYLVIFFNQIADILNFILLSPGYFCVITNIFELFSGTQLSLWEQCDIF